MARRAYHSSLSDPEQATPRRRVRIGASVAFVADLGAGLPKEYAACDLLYSEVAWEHGYKLFVERAGGGNDYATYLHELGRIAETAPAPCIFICGKRALREMPKPAETVPVNLNTGGRFIAEAVAVTYRCRLPRVKERHRDWTNIDTEHLLHALADRYACVGDPSCGYGNTGRVFLAHGKRFVMSDVNPACIGHIAEHVPSWERA